MNRLKVFLSGSYSDEGELEKCINHFIATNNAEVMNIQYQHIIDTDANFPQELFSVLIMYYEGTD